MGTDKEWKPFVQNIVDCWRHCPGKENAADIPSRGTTTLELAKSMLWHHGPSWLTSPELNNGDGVLLMPEEALEEMKSKDHKLIHICWLLMNQTSTSAMS